MGQVLEQIEPTNRNQYSQDTGTGTRQDVAEKAGISKRQKDTALRVAAISEDEFEDPTNSGQQPTLSELAARCGAYSY